MAHVHLYFLMCFLVPTLTYGQESITAVINHVKVLQKDISQLKEEVPRFETRVLTKMGMLELILRADVMEKIVPSYIQGLVEQSFKHMLSEQSFDAMVQNYMYSQVKHLKQAYQVLKTQVQSLSRHMRQNKITKTIPGQTVKCDCLKSERKINIHYSDIPGVMNGSEQTETGTLVRNLQTTITTTRSHVRHVGLEVKSLSARVSLLNQTCEKALLESHAIKSTVDSLGVKTDQEQTGRLEGQCRILKDCLSQSDDSLIGNTGDVTMGSTTAVNVTKLETSPRGFTASPGTSVAAITATTPVSTLATASKATTQSARSHVGEMTRILVVKLESFTAQNPHQIDIHNNAMTVYGSLHVSHISSVTFDPRSRRLIFCRHLPKVILSSNLDSSHVRRLRKGVVSLGMAVDVERRLVFLTTFIPRRTVSRMSTRGKHFQGIVDLSGHGSYNPYNIALDTKKKKIYFCKNSDGLWSVDYNGKNLYRMLKTGSSSAVTLDSERNIMYFSDAEKVMKLSLSTGKVTEIMRLRARIWSMCYVHDSLYVAGYAEGFIDVIYLRNNVHFSLQNMKHPKNIVLPLP